MMCEYSDRCLYYSWADCCEPYYPCHSANKAQLNESIRAATLARIDIDSRREEDASH